MAMNAQKIKGRMVAVDLALDKTSYTRHVATAEAAPSVVAATDSSLLNDGDDDRDGDSDSDSDSEAGEEGEEDSDLSEAKVLPGRQAGPQKTAQPTASNDDKEVRLLDDPNDPSVHVDTKRLMKNDPDYAS